MAVYGMKIGGAASFGLSRDDEAWLEQNPGAAMAFERFCTGPVREDCLLPLELRPQVGFGLDEIEEANLWEYLFKE